MEAWPPWLSPGYAYALALPSESFCVRLWLQNPSPETSHLLLTTSPLWFWLRIKFAVHFRGEFLSFLCCEITWFKNNFSSQCQREPVPFFNQYSCSFFRYISWLETDIVACSDSVIHLIYRAFRWSQLASQCGAHVVLLWTGDFVGIGWA